MLCRTVLGLTPSSVLHAQDSVFSIRDAQQISLKGMSPGGLGSILGQENYMQWPKGGKQHRYTREVSSAMAFKGPPIGEAERGGKNILDVADMRKCFQERLHHVCRTVRRLV